MPDQKTHADSIRLYNTGASAHAAAQTDPNTSLGKFLSGTEIQCMSISRSNNIANVSVDYAARENGEGGGTLTASGADELRWTPPGGTQGPAVTIANGETKILEGGGGELQKYLRVSRTSATALSGTDTITLSKVLNNAVGFDNVSSAEQAAGDTEYRCIGLKNESGSSVENVKAYIKTLGSTQTTDGGQLGAAGAGTVITTGNMDAATAWPASGFAHIKTSGGATREIVYYTSRTATTLTVPAAGRGLLGTSAAAGGATDTMVPVPGVRIAKEAPTSQPNGQFTDKTGAGEGSAPALTFNNGITSATGESIGTLATTYIQGIWIERKVVAGATAQASNEIPIAIEFDAA